MSEKQKKRAATPANEDEDSMGELVKKFKNAAKVKPPPRDVQDLKIDIRPEKIKPKHEKRDRRQPSRLLNLVEIKKPVKNGVRVTSAKNNKKAPTDRSNRSGRTTRSVRTGRTGRTPKFTRKAPRDKPPAQLVPPNMINYRLPISFSSSSRSSSNSRKRLPVYRGTNKRATDDTRIKFNLKFPGPVLKKLKDMVIN